MQNLLHMQNNRLNTDHDCFLYPRVVIRIVQTKLKLILSEGKINVRLSVIFGLLARWLFLSDDLAEETDNSED